MEHLDEGTIHAWIDGALDATQSREIDAHVAQCATCSAAVAEARGLIAASSRILTALDDVPAGVVPKRAPAVAPAVSTTARRRRIAAWVPALAAAALVVAVGLQVTGRPSEVATAGDGAQDSAVRAGAQAQLVKQVADSAVREQTAANASPRLVDLGGIAGGRAAGPVASPAPAPARAQDVAAGAAATQRRAAPPSAPSAPPASRLDEVVVTSRSDVAAAKSVAAEVGAVAADSARMKLESANALARDMSTGVVAGCYVLSEEAKRAPTAIAGGAVAPRERTQTLADARSRAPAAAAAPAPTAAAGFAQRVAPAIVRLDTIAQPSGMRVLTGRGDTLVGWWTRLGSDSARVRLQSGLVFTVEARNRVSCVEPPRQ